MELAKTLKLRLRVGDLDLPEKMKRYARRLEEEEMDAQVCPLVARQKRVELT